MLSSAQVARWTVVVYEVELDGYRAIGVNPTRGKAILFSRRGKLLDRKAPSVAEALNALAKSTVVDGEVVALDSEGRRDFS
jgi:bifunctional non-homologous end joining protein LigD